MGLAWPREALGLITLIIKFAVFASWRHCCRRRSDICHRFRFMIVFVYLRVSTATYSSKTNALHEECQRQCRSYTHRFSRPKCCPTSTSLLMFKNLVQKIGRNVNAHSFRFLQTRFFACQPKDSHLSRCRISGYAKMFTSAKNPPKEMRLAVIAAEFLKFVSCRKNLRPCFSLVRFISNLITPATPTRLNVAVTYLKSEQKLLVY